MIHTHVRAMAEKRGITTAYQLQKALSVSPSVAARLWKDDFDFISRKTLDTLCKVLRCKPQTLISHQEEESIVIPAPSVSSKKVRNLP